MSKDLSDSGFSKHRLWLLSGLVAAGHVLIAISASYPKLWTVMAVAAGVAGYACYLAWKARISSLPLILGVAVIARLCVFPVPPGLSSDIYRYLWDGWLTIRGVNPFAFTPTDPTLSEFRHLYIYGKFNSPGYHTVYPPVSQFVFAAGAFVYEKFGFYFGYYTIKGFFALAELGALGILARLVPPRSVILYAWNPLVILSTWAQPHGEAVAILAIAATIFALSGKRGHLACGALTLAVWTKLWPVLLFPFLMRKLDWQPRFFIFPAALTVLLWWPFWHPLLIPQLLESLNLYVNTFEFNAGLYYFLKWTSTGLLRLSGVIDPGAETGAIVASLLRGALLGTTGVIYFCASRRKWSFVREVTVVSCLFVLSLTTIHPWYLAPILFLLPFFRHIDWSWFVLALFAPATYLRYTQGDLIYWAVVCAGWLAWAWIGWRLWQRRQQTPFANTVI